MSSSTAVTTSLRMGVVTPSLKGAGWDTSLMAEIEKDKATTEVDAAEEDYVLPRDDDDYSPAHGEDDVGTGVGDEPEYTEEDVLAAAAEHDAVIV